MSTDQQDLIYRIAMADKAAQEDFPHEDLSSPVAACPARQQELFIVPARYALAERSAGHDCFSPASAAQSHPMALRRLRPGYLYLWSHQGPLRRFAVATDGLLSEQPLDADDTPLQSGTLPGLALNKQQEAWLLYSEIPIGTWGCQQLAEDPAQRAQRMRHIDLPEIARTLQARHCPPLEHAERLVAELMPEVREQALAHDYAEQGEAYRQGVDSLGAQMMAEPTPERIQAYVDARTWLHEREQAAQRHPGAADSPPGVWSAHTWSVPATDRWLNQARQAAGALHTVFASLDDDLGVLRDLNHEQEQLETRHEGWVADNNLRQSVGGFIRSLISEDGGEVANLLNYRYRGHDISLTPLQGEQILESQRQLEPLLKEESRINQQRGRQYGHREADGLLAQVHSQIDAVTAPVQTFIPAELYSKTQQLIREYRQDKVTHLAGGRASAQVAASIDLERLDDWLDQQVPAHYRQVEERHTALYADRATYLPRHAAGTWFVDYQDPAHQQWLDKLALACLSAQCSRQVGVEQFVGYVRSDDPGSLRLVFYAWSPSLELAVNLSNRLNEILGALSLDNLAATRQALASVLDEPALNALQRLAQDTQGAWAVTVGRLGAALMALKSQTTVVGQWAGALLVTRFGANARLLPPAGREGWRLLGGKADALNQWVRHTAQAIGQGRASALVNSPVVQNSGGLLPLTALLLNSLNASHHLGQASAVEGMDTRRQAEVISSSLYAGAALVAVMQNWLILGRGMQELSAIIPGIGPVVAPTLTLFGGFIGLLSFGAAGAELISLQNQIENAQTRIDPWLERRQLVVQGQIGVYAAQAALGMGLTGLRMANRLTTPQALRYFRLGMGPINLLLLGLGGAYLYAWSQQATPLQNYLAGCCWSKTRARRQEVIPAEQQHNEFNQLVELLYQPRLSIKTRRASLLGSLSHIESLSIDLPGAEPGSVRLDLALLGNPTNMDALRESSSILAPTPFSDLGGYWLQDSNCTWIPADEGQGLRLSGGFKLPRPFFGPPTRLYLRLRYHSPVALLAELDTPLGGEQGLAYSIDAEEGIIPLRASEPTPVLDGARLYPLGAEPNALFLYPKET